MPARMSSKGNSGAEDRFISLFAETFGPEKAQYLHMQYPTLDIYGRHRTIDFALKSAQGRVAMEVDGNTWHQPSRISEDKYHDDLLKQNSLVYDGWKVYRWTSRQIEKTPDRVRDELVTFLGQNPVFQLLEDAMPRQSGETLSLMEHQTEALACLEQMRAEHKTMALLYHATGSGKTTTAVMDARRMGKRTLFLAHRGEIVEQAVKTFQALWPEATTGLFTARRHVTDTMVVCATVQSLAQHLELFSPEDFGYLIIDECHHGTADTYRGILSYFRPLFTLGLTATPERADGEDLLKIFQDVAHRLDLKSAVEAGVLCPVRCIRVRTNIDMQDVRMNGYRYNYLDLESTLMVPGRNQLIADTYEQYVPGRRTVMFCTSVAHAKTMAEMLVSRGFRAECVYGGLPAGKREKILSDFAAGRVSVLCACDLLNEGWDCPAAEVLFMARPTLSRTVYMQQLGRGMRKAPGKDFLMVFDFVDNANMFNRPYTMHRLLQLHQYAPGTLVLGRKGDVEADLDLFRRGQKPDALVDYPIHMADLEAIDLLSWQEASSGMLSEMAFTQNVNVQAETVARYIREGKLVPDLSVPVGEKRFFHFFRMETVEKACETFGWKRIYPETLLDTFLDMAEDMHMSYSYKPVFLLAFLDHMDRDGKAWLEDITASFRAFYDARIERGQPAEKRPCILTRGGYTDKDVERLILSMPYRRFEQMNIMHHARQLGYIQLHDAIARRMDADTVAILRERCRRALRKYFGENTDCDPA